MGKRAKLDETEAKEEEEEEDVDSIREEFEEMGIDARLANVLADEFGISKLFPLQKHAVQSLVLNESQDACISAPTGSGKTLMFTLPLVHALSKRIVPRVRGLVLCPSRDLAKQVHAVVNSLASAVRLNAVLIAGEVSLFQEGKLLAQDVDIVVATPGRLLDHLTNTSKFTLEHLEYVICDEADRLLAQSYQDWLDRVYEHAYRATGSSNPRTFSHTRSVYSSQQTRLRKILCSATLTKNPEKLAKLAMFRPLLIQEEDAAGKLPPTLTEITHRVSFANKPLVLLHLLHNRIINATTAADAPATCIVFCSSIARTERVYSLCSSAFPGKCGMIAGSKDTQERAKLLLEFKRGKFPILIGSDLAARGIDVPNLSLVISYDVPAHASTYVHRSGRTARAGAKGTSIVLLQNQQARHFREIKAKVGSTEPLRFVDVDGEQLLSEWKPVLEAWKKSREE